MMCRKKTIDTQPPWNSRTVCGVVVGNYPGTVNDLDGPVPDFEDLKKEILDRWPDMAYRGFKDEQATRARFLSELNEAVNHVGEDGMLFFIMDTCHAESSTRNGGFRHTRRKAFRGPGYDKVLVFSSSLSSQSSSDAQFPGGANGAWHYALLKTIAKGITYRQWFDNAKALLAQAGFSQIPVIEGPEELQNRLIFEGNVITVQVSSHGGQVDDLDGDEPDGLDEVIYLYDRMVRDDEIRKILEKTKRRTFVRFKHKITRSMKVKSFKSTRDFKEDWPNTLISFAFLAFTVLAGFGVIDGEQAAQAGPIVSSTIGAISTAIAGVIALIGVLKKKPPVV
jgi:hypothetical protein